jgi:two-component system, LytTR family, response regulator
MLQLKCINIDDEQLGRKIVDEYIAEVPFLQHLGSGKNAFEAIEMIENLKPDLVFLDVQMPGLLGTQLLSGLSHKPMVIFITAYEQYAVESYELNVVDYIMKPLSLERFMKAVLKAHTLFKNSQKNLTESDIDHMFVSVEYSLVKINFDSITHIEGLKDYIKIFVNHAVHPILTKSTLKGIEERLPSQSFFRVQKSFIVNLNKIESIRNHRIFIGKYEIPVSETHMPTLLQTINYNKP